MGQVSEATQRIAQAKRRYLVLFTSNKMKPRCRLVGRPRKPLTFGWRCDIEHKSATHSKQELGCMHKQNKILLSFVVEGGPHQRAEVSRW
jgi:hypothetical protein